MVRRIHCNSIKLEIKWIEKLDFVCNCATYLFIGETNPRIFFVENALEVILKMNQDIKLILVS